MSGRGQHTLGTAADFFGRMADSYDSLIRRAVPRYREMTNRLIETLPHRADRVLELGCGTGTLSLALVKRFAEASYTFTDASSEMVEITRARLSAAERAHAARACFVAEDFGELAHGEATYDLVVSSISLHHVRDKGRLYRRVHAVLERGGHLCFADQFRGATDELHARNWSRWLAFCREPGDVLQ